MHIINGSYDFSVVQYAVNGTYMSTDRIHNATISLTLNSYIFYEANTDTLIAIYPVNNVSISVIK